MEKKEREKEEQKAVKKFNKEQIERNKIQDKRREIEKDNTRIRHAECGMESDAGIR